MKLKFYSLIVLFLSFFGLLIIQAFNDGTSSVYLPSEIIEKNQDLKRVRVAGRVADSEVNYQVQPNFRLDFKIKDPEVKDQKNLNSSLLTVIYNGIKPDMFAVERDVIIDGEYQGGVLIAKQLLTQCPSKYEPPKPKSSSNQNSKY